MKRLAPQHELAFVGFYEREQEAPNAEEIRKLCAQTQVRLRRPTPHAYASFANVPFWVSEFYSDELAQALSKMNQAFRPEVAFFCSTNMAQYRRFVRGAAVVVTGLELNCVAQARRITAARGFERFRARLEWARMLRYETAIFRQVEHAVAVSESDAEIIRALAPRVAVTPVPPGVNRELLAPRTRRPHPGTVLYVGHMEHFPNLDGLLFLYRDIWPLLLREYPQAKLTVAGGGLHEELTRFAPEVLTAMERDASVELAGFVPDLYARMDETAVLAAPLRLGGGVRNKIVESLAAGLPVVTTPRGAEGLAARSEQELLIADTPAEFARQLVRLLTEEELPRRLSAAGRALAAREHDNEMLAKRLAQALTQAVGARK